MKLFKRIICIAIVTLLSLLIYSTVVKAANTLKVKADTLNLRQKASTSSDIVTLLSKGDTCELIEEDGDWYKVKYKTYTGYVSKEYVEKVETDSNEGKTNTMEKENTENIDSSKDEKDNNKGISNVESVEITGKISKKTVLKMVPLIYSSEIATLNKNEEVTILSELNGWSYIQTETLTGWIRTDSIEGRQTNTNSIHEENIDNNKTTSQTDVSNNTDKDNNNLAVDNTVDTNNTDGSYTEKTMYVNDSFVNVRKEPSTSSEIIMTLALNTKLTVIGESGEWYKVNTSEGEAYVSKELLSSKQVTTTRGGVIKIVSNSSDNIAETTVKTENANKVTTKDSNTTTTTKDSSTTTLAKGQEIVAYAKQFLGVPYVYGGASKSGFDCSGFTMYVYEKYGISMSHSAQAQSKLGKNIKADKNSASSLKQNLQVGDLVFFLDYETMEEVGHCGIYIGDGNFIHASSGSGYCVKINSLLPGEYYNTRYCGARRVI